FLFFFYCCRPLWPPRSFPTRRSSDLIAAVNPGEERLGQVIDSLIAIVSGDKLRHGPILGSARRGTAQQLETHTHLGRPAQQGARDRKSTRLNSSHVAISYAVFCLKKR